MEQKKKKQLGRKGTHAVVNAKKLHPVMMTSISQASALMNQDSKPVQTTYDYKIVGGPAFAEVVVSLKPGQAIVADGGALQYWKGPVEPGSLKASGFFGRLFSGESVFTTQYSVPSDASATGTIAFASPWPGDAVCLELKPGEEWKLSRGAFIACSPNVSISGKLNWRGVFEVGQDEGFVLPKATCDPKSSANGFVFVAGYGGIQKHVVAAGDTLMVNNGLFMAAPGEVNYEIRRLGKNLLTSFFGAEGLGMGFTGPCTVYTQSRNLNDLIAEIAYRLPTGGSGGGSAIEIGVATAAGAALGDAAGNVTGNVVAEGLSDLFSGGAAKATMKKKRTTSKKKTKGTKRK